MLPARFAFDFEPRVARLLELHPACAAELGPLLNKQVRDEVAILVVLID